MAAGWSDPPRHAGGYCGGRSGSGRWCGSAGSGWGCSRCQAGLPRTQDRTCGRSGPVGRWRRRHAGKPAKGPSPTGFIATFRSIPSGRGGGGSRNLSTGAAWTGSQSTRPYPTDLDVVGRVREVRHQVPPHFVRGHPEDVPFTRGEDRPRPVTGGHARRDGGGQGDHAEGRNQRDLGSRAEVIVALWDGDHIKHLR